MRALGRADHIPQQRLPVFDWAAAKVVAVEMKKVEGEEREPLEAAGRDRLARRVDMGDALVGHRDLAIQHHRRQPGQDKRSERLGEQRGAVVAVAAQQPD
jgi:hypothetical protein